MTGNELPGKFIAPANRWSLHHTAIHQEITPVGAEFVFQAMKERINETGPMAYQLMMGNPTIDDGIRQHFNKKSNEIDIEEQITSLRRTFSNTIEVQKFPQITRMPFKKGPQKLITHGTFGAPEYLVIDSPSDQFQQLTTLGYLTSPQSIGLNFLLTVRAFQYSWKAKTEKDTLHAQVVVATTPHIRITPTPYHKPITLELRMKVQADILWSPEALSFFAAQDALVVNSQQTAYVLELIERARAKSTPFGMGKKW